MRFGVSIFRVLHGGYAILVIGLGLIGFYQFGEGGFFDVHFS